MGGEISVKKHLSSRVASRMTCRTPSSDVLLTSRYTRRSQEISMALHGMALTVNFVRLSCAFILNFRTVSLCNDNRL